MVKETKVRASLGGAQVNRESQGGSIRSRRQGCPSQNLILLPVLSEHNKVFNKVPFETMKTQMLMFKTLSSPESCGVGNSTPHQYSCLENSMARGAWWATVSGVAKNWTGLSVHASES